MIIPRELLSVYGVCDTNEHPARRKCMRYVLVECRDGEAPVTVATDGAMLIAATVPCKLADDVDDGVLLPPDVCKEAIQNSKAIGQSFVNVTAVGFTTSVVVEKDESSHVDRVFSSIEEKYPNWRECKPTGPYTIAVYDLDRLLALLNAFRGVMGDFEDTSVTIAIPAPENETDEKFNDDPVPLLVYGESKETGIVATGQILPKLSTSEKAPMPWWPEDKQTKQKSTSSSWPSVVFRGL